MSAYRKFSDTWEDADDRTLGGLATLGAHGGVSGKVPTLGALGTLGGHPPTVRRQDDLQELPSAPPKAPKPPKVLSIGNPSAAPSDNGWPRQVPYGSPKLAKAPKAAAGTPLAYAKAFAELRRGCPDKVDTARWQQCIRDAHVFLHDWADQAFAFGWQTDDLFGLDPVAPLARYDVMGLAWYLQGNPVVALTTDAATIRMPMPTRAVLKFYRRGVDHEWASKRA